MCSQSKYMRDICKHTHIHICGDMVVAAARRISPCFCCNWFLYSVRCAVNEKNPDYLYIFFNAFRRDRIFEW